VTHGRHRAIEALEAEVGRKLFDRHSNGVTLTFDGQQFLQRARAIEASVSDAMRGPHRWGTQVDGTVDVAVSYTVAGYFLPPLLSRFWRAFPGITVRLHKFERYAIGAVASMPPSFWSPTCTTGAPFARAFCCVRRAACGPARIIRYCTRTVFGWPILPVSLF
jgi:hypothetical protein